MWSKESGCARMRCFTMFHPHDDLSRSATVLGGPVLDKPLQTNDHLWGTLVWSFARCLMSKGLSKAPQTNEVVSTCIHMLQAFWWYAYATHTHHDFLHLCGLLAIDVKSCIFPRSVGAVSPIQPNPATTCTNACDVQKLNTSTWGKSVSCSEVFETLNGWQRQAGVFFGRRTQTMCTICM